MSSRHKADAIKPGDFDQSVNETSSRDGAKISDEEYERAAASAIARMKQGFHMGGGWKVSRDELHERERP